MRYRTIVADPPWPMPATGKTTRGETDQRGRYIAKSGRVENGDNWGRSRGKSVFLPYDTMTLDEITALPVAALAEADAHLYLWTTNRFLEASYDVVRAWGFRPAQLLVWCKPPMGIGFGGAFTTTTEFVVFARRGSLAHLQRRDSSWWQWSRPYANGGIAHSAKPEAFLDLVEQVSPGPYLEMFARRARFGWDYWGDQSLGTVELESA
jgi:N6-adenosine-specific RNA methylase IME4